MRRAAREKVLALIKSERGGISGIVFEVILVAVALTLLVSVVYLFRGNMEIIGSSANKANELEKVKAASLIPLDKNVVNGGDVISVIRYYAKDPSLVEVEVKVGVDTHVYKGRDYDFALDAYRSDLFDAVYTYTGEGTASRLTKASYTRR